MRENVGGADRVARAVAGPALLAFGVSRWLLRGGSPGALLAAVAGALIAETALTRVCPVNELLGVDSARRIQRA